MMFFVAPVNEVHDTTSHPNLAIEWPLPWHCFLETISDASHSLQPPKLVANQLQLLLHPLFRTSSTTKQYRPYTVQIVSSVSRMARCSISDVSFVDTDVLLRVCVSTKELGLPCASTAQQESRTTRCTNFITLTAL